MEALRRQGSGVLKLILLSKKADKVDMFEWKPEYSVNIAAIDTEHKRLFVLAGELHVAMSQGKGKMMLERAFARLIDYTKEHFVHEELFMRKHGYPGADAHKVLHDDLTAKVVDFKQRFSQGEQCLTVALMSFLQDWLKHHIEGSDQKYASHIRSKNSHDRIAG